MFCNKKKATVEGGETRAVDEKEKEEATARAQKCAKEINDILLKNRCFFNPMIIWTGQGGFTSTVKIVPIMDEKIEDPMLAKIHNNGHDPRNDN